MNAVIPHKYDQTSNEERPKFYSFKDLKVIFSFARLQKIRRLKYILKTDQQKPTVLDLNTNRNQMQASFRWSPHIGAALSALLSRDAIFSILNAASWMYRAPLKPQHQFTLLVPFLCLLINGWW